MRLRSLVLAAATVAVTVLAGQGVAAASPSPTYYLALGDSLSQGYQPGQGDTDQGYVDDLYATLHAREPGLQLVKLGCSGETTTTMRTGGICPYPGAGSQLAAAEKFLRAHRHDVRYVTIDVGANDVDKCASAAGIDVNCAADGLRSIARNLLPIMSGLRHAAGYVPQLIAMNYYDPFLAAWLLGTSGHTLARESVAITAALNAVESFEYSLFGARIADVAGAFHTTDFGHPQTLPGIGSVPRNVATICTLTYMCTQTNIHPNPAGYRLIAAAFTDAISRW